MAKIAVAIIFMQEIILKIFFSKVQGALYYLCIIFMREFTYLNKM